LGHLHGDWEIVCCLGREEYVDCLLCEWDVGCFVSDLDDVELLISSLFGRGRASSPLLQLLS
jgi:hypothetical protein